MTTPSQPKKYNKMEKLFLYKFAYPVFNFLGLGRGFNKIWHKLGMYDERADGMCWWCGDYHHGHFEPNYTNPTSNDVSPANSVGRII